MNDWTFELIAGPYGGTTEGPAWDGQALLFTHIPGNRIMRYDPTHRDRARSSAPERLYQRADVRCSRAASTGASPGTIASPASSLTAR